MRPRAYLYLLLLLALAVAAGAVSCSKAGLHPTLVTFTGATYPENAAASELRRYFYLRTGLLPEVQTAASLDEAPSNSIVIAEKGSGLLVGLADPAAAARVAELGAQEYLLKTTRHHGKKLVLLVGGDGPGVLYAAYRLAEHLGVRFYLEGDVVPDEKLSAFHLDFDERDRPLFAVRGIQPFHDFPEGPDWWDLDNYKAVLSQLPKLRMNFFGLHTYPEKSPNAEPTVWIGRPGDYAEDGQVTAAYPASYQNTLRGNWGYETRKTGEFHFGAHLLFERDDYGNDVMADLSPEPGTAEDSNLVFNRAADVFRNAFTFARKLGVQTCVGAETALTLPELVRNRLRAERRDFRNPAVVRDVYKAIFGRIAAAYPIDYYWFWTWEGWTWDDAPAAAVQTVTSDLAQAVRAWQEVAPPFKLATSGWVLGPPSNRTLFDQVLPKDIAMSCINREVGKAPVDPTFSRIQGRSLWAIPWLEDDPSLTSPQLWVGRMRRDAADARRYGCDGLLGIHWRTRILSANVSALAHAAWDQSWSTVPRDLEKEAGPMTGQQVTLEDRPIEGAGPDAAVYKDVRDRVFAYNIPVPDGFCDVTLRFVEGQINRARGRVFDVVIEGKKVAESVDIFARVGRFKALDLTSLDVEVTDGRLNIEFIDRIHYPAIAAISIKGDDYTKNINCGGPAVADYEADWPDTPRFLDSLDFYRDWAENQFGLVVAEDAAAVLASVDGRHAVPSVWTNGPGGLQPDARPWDEVAPLYAFVDRFSALRTKVAGAGNLERFDYWRGQFETMRETARFNCLWAMYNSVLADARAAQSAAERAALAKESPLRIRLEMAASLKRIFGGLLETVSTTGELGTIANWEQHILPGAWERPNAELRGLMGEDLPADIDLGQAYKGNPRIIVPAVRTSLEAGESLTLKVILLAKAEPSGAGLYWRELGTGEFQVVPFEKVDRCVYRVRCPAQDVDFEYYLKAVVDGRDVAWPPTAPALNQTVVVFR
jgi:hypothetical protein